MAVADGLEQSCEARVGRHDVAVAALEELSPLARDRVWVFEVFLEQIAREAGVQAVDVSHFTLCSSGVRYQSGWLVTTATAMPTRKLAPPIAAAYVARRSLLPPIPTASNARTMANGISRSGRYAMPVKLTKIDAAARNPATVSAGRLLPYGVELMRAP